MVTAKQKEAARHNIKKAQKVQSQKVKKSQKSQKSQKAGSSRPKGPKKAARQPGLSTADKNKLDNEQFAFPKERKEPLVDAKHVRNAVARFDQVEGVTDKERDQAWRRIETAARKFGVEIEEKGWRELFSGGKATKKR